MNQIQLGIIVFVLQIVFEFLRSVNVRYTSRDLVFMAVLTGFFVKMLWLFTTFMGVKSMIDGDYFVAMMYVLGGTIGSYLSFKIKIKYNAIKQ